MTRIYRSAGLFFTAAFILATILSAGHAVADVAGVPGLRTLSPQQWSTKAVMIGEGVKFKLNDYVAATSLRNMPSMKFVFDGAFQSRFLSKPAQYTEEVQETDDRLVVTRTLVLDTKNPCDPAMEKEGFSVCFKKSGKPAKPEVKQYLDKVRAKIRNQVNSNPNDPRSIKAKPYLQMSDEQLLDQILNKDSLKKKIVVRSVVPYLAYEFRKVPQMDLSDARLPLPRTNQFVFKQVQSPAAGANILPAGAAGILPPAITSFSPERGKHGDKITIVGTNMNQVLEAGLSDTTDMYPQTIESRGADRIVMSNYAPAGPKKVSLKWARGTVESARSYNVYFEPIRQMPPAPGPYRFNNVKEIHATFLTGWTFARRYHKSYEIEFAEETWATDRYYARFSFDFTAGFGLRWPFKVDGSATIDKVYGRGTPGTVLNYPAMELCSGIGSIEGEDAKKNAPLCAQRATVRLTATPLNASADFYRNIGVPQDKIFGGKEFVFEAGLSCRFKASIPGPNIEVSCPRSLTGIDLGEHFVPQLGGVSRDIVSKSISGRPFGLALDFALGYAALNPGFTVRGKNGSLKLDVSGHLSQPAVNNLTMGSGPNTLFVTERNASGPWGIDLSNPRYSVDVSLVPTLQVELGIDLGVYSWNKRFGPFSVDALALEMGQANFDRHEGTVGTYRFRDIGMRPMRPPQPVTSGR